MKTSRPYVKEIIREVKSKPKTRIGTYAPRFSRIINNGWGDTEWCKEIAIHKYAHHIHFTEKDKTRKKENPHGKQFWQIYGQLILLAKQKGLYSHPGVIDICPPLAKKMSTFRSSDIIWQVVQIFLHCENVKEYESDQYYAECQCWQKEE